MNIVDFSEGILGINGNAAKVVAEHLFYFAPREEDFDMSIKLFDLALDLEAGKRTDIKVIRQIGEQRLTEIQQRCLAHEKED